MMRMSSKPDYTPDEWQLLLDVPPLVGTAVMVAGNSGLGTLKEAMAIANATLDVQHGYEENELIQSLIHARTNEGDRSEVEGLANPYRGKQPDEIRDMTIAKCTELSHLLDQKSSPQEAREFKQWALSVGEKVAEAAKEGGFLGIGGERVSEVEKDVLSAVSTALGLCQ
jgi:hypothetical protein